MEIRSTYGELEAAADKRYERWVASLPEPKVINVEALMAFDAPRKFVWGGVGLRAPPLSFRSGIRLFVAANALRDLRSASASPAEMHEASLATVRLLRSVLRPQNRFRRLTRWDWSLRRSSAPEIESLLRWLLHVPDEAKVPANASQVTIDYMAVLADFVREFPAWVGPDGFPRSWSVYIYGSRHINRARAREDLRHALAVRAGRADELSYRRFNESLKPQAGWSNG